MNTIKADFVTDGDLSVKVTLINAPEALGFGKHSTIIKYPVADRPVDIDKIPYVLAGTVYKSHRENTKVDSIPGDLKDLKLQQVANLCLSEVQLKALHGALGQALAVISKE